MKKLSAAWVLVLAALPFGASAQAWPTKPVRFILSLGPGSGADLGARLYADRLTKMWGQPVVVENRPGGDGVIAINAVIQAKDDHTLLWGPTANFVGHPRSSLLRHRRIMLFLGMSPVFRRIPVWEGGQ